MLHHLSGCFRARRRKEPIALALPRPTIRGKCFSKFIAAAARDISTKRTNLPAVPPNMMIVTCRLCQAEPGEHPCFAFLIPGQYIQQFDICK
jgi:hypothetical protein